MSTLPGLRTLLCALCLVLTASSAHGQAKRAPASTPAKVDPFDRPPFSLSAQELLGLRGKPPAGVDVEVLLDDTILRYDADGRVETEYRAIYRVLTDKGADDWGSIGASYRPWHQNKAEVRARVITREGAAFELDPKTLVDALASQNGGNVYSDRRRMGGPLPAVRAGAVVETQVKVKDHKPMFAAGTLQRSFLYVNTYTALTRLIIEAPQGYPLAIQRRGALPAPQVSKRGNLQVTTFAARDLLPLSAWPGALDPAYAPEPFVDVSTAKSWNAVASEYARTVDAELANFDAKSIADGVLAGETNSDAKLAKLLAHVHAQVRYTGLELGERSILPNPPADTLARHYGDCKDKSTLLVGLLRAAGFDAHVALLRSGNGLDVFADAPGFGLFDHAIVHVAGKTPLWIDPTDPYSAIGVLPYGDQDRLALIASAKTQALSRTPRVSEQLSRSEEDIYVQFPQLGRATVKEVSHGAGPAESELRGAFDKDPAQLREQLKSYVKERYHATLASAEAGSPADLTKPFQLVIEGSGAEAFETFDDGGSVQLLANSLYRHLPPTLYETPDSERSEKERKEEAEAKDPRFREAAPSAIYVARQHHDVIRYHLEAPRGYRWHTLPDPLRFEAEGISVSRSLDKKSEREIVVSFEVTAKTRLIPAAKLQAVRGILHAFDQQSAAQVRFVHAAGEALDEHKIVDAMRIHRELLGALPKEVPVQARYAKDLLRMGFGSVARQVADKLVKDHPKSARAHWARGYVYLHDLAGRDSAPGADFKEAEKSMRKALELDPEEALYYRALAAILVNQTTRVYPLDMQRLAELGGLFEKLRSKFDEHGNDEALLRNYVFQGKFREAVALAEELGSSTHRDGMWVAAVAALEGASAAQRKAEQLSGGSPAHNLGYAIAILAAVGHYAPSRALVALPIVQKELGAMRRMVESTANRDQCLAQLAPAARATYDWLKSYLVDYDRVQNPQNTLDELPRQSLDAYGLAQTLRGLVQSVNFYGNDALMLSGRLAADGLPCFMRWEVEEQAGAVRVKLLAPGQSGDDVPTFYLRHVKNTHEVVGARIKGRTIPFSRAILLAVAQNKLDEARAWLGWAKQIVAPHGGSSNKLDFYDALKLLWPTKPETASAEELSLIGAALAGAYGAHPRDTQLLDNGLKRASTPEQVRALRYFVSLALEQREPKRAVELLAPLYAEFPEDKHLTQRYLTALGAARRHAELPPLLAAYEQRFPNEPFTQHIRNEIGRREGNYAPILEATLERMAKNQANKEELNNVAWNALFTSADLNKAIKVALAACEPLEDAGLGSIHTLASVYADAGDLDNAYRYLTRLLADERSKFWDANWYPIGRLAAALGLPEAARDAWKRVEKDEVPRDNGTYALTQLALAKDKKERPQAVSDGR